MANGSDITQQHLLQQLDDNYALDNLPTMVFLGMLMTVGFVGNSLVFFVYLTKMKSSTSRCFILALSLLDLITCFICTPIDIVDFRYNYSFGDFGTIPCKVTAVVAFTSFASGNVLIAVAAERYKKICNPTGSQTTIRAAKVAVLFSCIAAFFESLPSFVLYGEHTKEMVVRNVSVNATMCTTSDEYIATTLPLVNNGVQFVIFVVATAALVVLYSLIWKKVSGFAERKKWSWRFDESCADASSVSKLEAGLHACVTSDMNSSQKGSTLCKTTLDVFTSDDVREPVTGSLTPSKVKTLNADKGDIVRRRSKRQMSARRTTLMLFVITFTFILSYLPHLSLMAAREVHWEKIENLSGPALAVYNVFLRSYFINSAINPVIYSYCNVAVRNEIKAFVSFKRCRN